MKDLSVEQKAKRYDEALGKARQLCDYSTSKPFISDLQDLFPELKVSEGERMWKLLKKYVHYNISDTVLEADYMTRECLESWIEKQCEHAKFLNSIQVGDQVTRNEDGELFNLSQLNRVAKPNKQKSVDNVEPKFNVGDWIVFNGLTLYINDVVKGYYRTISKDGIPNSYDWDIDNAARLWTIKEARDGAVLVCESGWTCIFKALVNDETFSSYCFMDSTGWFCGQGSECHTLKEEFVKAYNGKIQPATKEQRDFFFAKMQEAGYEWNAEKKVLKNLKPKFNVGDWIVSANGKVNQVISVDADNVDFEGYTLDNDVYFSGTWCNSYHLWTIKDAKEGDVLSYETDEGELWIMIYWSLYEPYEGHVHYHALLVNDDFTDKGTCCICIDNLKPATIEQHELLFRKMKEEGYQWDKNKKEVIKL